MLELNGRMTHVLKPMRAFSIVAALIYVTPIMVHNSMQSFKDRDYSSSSFVFIE
jgi:hypothetical protein